MESIASSMFCHNKYLVLCFHIACASVVMPKSVYELLGCWQGRFYFHGIAKVCELCFMNL